MSINNMEAELALRLSKIQKEITDAGADAILLTSNVNLLYVSGMLFSGLAYIPAKGGPLFFVRRPVGIAGQGVVYIRKVEDAADYLIKEGIGIPAKLMFENDSISYSDHQRLAKAFDLKEILNATPVMRAVRSVKTPYEIEQIRISAQRHMEVYAKIPQMYRPGMSDNELSISIEHEIRLRGSLGLFRVSGESMEIFMGSLLAGDNADTPSPYDFALGGGGMDASLPVGSNGTVLKDGMSVMVDMGANYTGYMADMSRVFSIGTLSDLAYKAHDISIAISDAVADMARPGTAAKDIYELAAKMAADAGLSDYFMGYTQKAGFVGHGLGMEINEAPVFAPRSRDVLEEGTIFALEPKFVIPGTGAVGVENTYVVRSAGVETLTDCPQEIIEL